MTATGEFRYGDDRTVHGTEHLNVEVDTDGKVVAVWFRCMLLPFDKSVADAHRAADMKSAYAEHPPEPLIAVVLKTQ